LKNNLYSNLYVVGEDAGNDRDDECNSILMNNLRGTGEIFPSAADIENIQYDMVVANILAPILINLAPTLAKHVKCNGKLAMSGIIAKQASSVVNAYKVYFKNVQVEETEEDWVLVTASN
jgi:ribosomal protein L11 methylase PrmA